jgi:nucleoside 2-deoxyribosyltransferase
MKVYLCGPINGRSDDDCKVWREAAKAVLPDTLDPMRRDYRGREAESVDEIVELDKEDVLACDALLVYYDKPSVGTSMEILFAWEHRRPVVLVNKSDAPLSPWLVYHSRHIVSTLDEAITILKGTP